VTVCQVILGGQSNPAADYYSPNRYFLFHRISTQFIDRLVTSWPDHLPSGNQKFDWLDVCGGLSLADDHDSVFCNRLVENVGSLDERLQSILVLCGLS